MITCFCAGKGRQDPYICLKNQLVGDVINCFPLPLTQVHWDPNTEHGYSYLPWACVQQEAGLTDGGLRTPLQTLNHHSLSSLFTPPLPSSARYGISSVLTQLNPLPILLFSWNNTISDSINLFKYWYNFSFASSEIGWDLGPFAAVLQCLHLDTSLLQQPTTEILCD